MKVKELIEILSNLDPELIVVLQRDSEGNGYEEMGGVDNTPLVFDQKYREVKFRELTDDLQEQGYTEEDVGTGIPCVVLYP